MAERYDAMVAKEVKGQTYWNRIGVAFPFRDKDGFNVSLDAIPVPTDGAYKFALFPVKQNNDSGGNRQQSNYGNGGGNGGGGSSGGRPGANRNDGYQQQDDDIPF